jgi:V/A-type H+-transporting ATPase subunit E
MTNSKTHITSSGVEALIERLKNEGVTAGQEKAEDIVANAQKHAKWIIEEAELEAKELIATAHKQAHDIEVSGTDAIQLAGRDALLKLRDTLLGSFSHEVMRVVGDQMSDQQFTNNLILTLAGNVRDKIGLDQHQDIVISLPEDVMGVEELRKNPEELNEGALSQYTASIAANLLRKGVLFKVSDDIQVGLSVRLVDNKMVVDFTDETVAALLLEHIQPRFRALLQGIVK